MENNEINKISDNTACIDCIFWYQCRRGIVDCHLKAMKSIKNLVRA